MQKRTAVHQHDRPKRNASGDAFVVCCGPSLKERHGRRPRLSIQDASGGSMPKVMKARPAPETMSRTEAHPGTEPKERRQKVQQKRHHDEADEKPKKKNHQGAARTRRRTGALPAFGTHRPARCGIRRSRSVCRMFRLRLGRLLTTSAAAAAARTLRSAQPSEDPADKPNDGARQKKRPNQIQKTMESRHHGVHLHVVPIKESLPRFMSSWIKILCQM